MNTIYADFNAMTEADHVCLTTRGSRDDLQRRGIRVGDWAWLSDGELVVGAKVADDPRYDLVGIPAWETLIYLEPDGALSSEDIWAEFAKILHNPERSKADESRVLQLLGWFEALAPQPVKEALLPGFLAYHRASALWALGRYELGLQETAKALEADPNHPGYLYLNLVLLSTVDLDQALQVAQRLVADPATQAGVLAQCVNVLAAHLDRLSGSEFMGQYQTLLHWVERFHDAPGFETIPALLPSQVLFTQGMALLRKNEIAEARDCFATILKLNPKDQAAQEAMRLNRFDDHARHLAQGYRARATALAA